MFSTAKKKETCIEFEILQEIVVNYTIAIFLGLQYMCLIILK